MKLFSIVFVMYGMTLAAPVAQPEEGSDSHIARAPLNIITPVALPTLPGGSLIGLPTIAIPPAGGPTGIPGLPSIGLPSLGLPSLGLPSLGLPTLAIPLPTATPTLPGLILPTGTNLGTLPGHLVSTIPAAPLPTATSGSLPPAGAAGPVSQLVTLIEQILASGGAGIPPPILLALEAVKNSLKGLGL